MGLPDAPPSWASPADDGTVSLNNIQKKGNVRNPDGKAVRRESLWIKHPHHHRRIPNYSDSCIILKKIRFTIHSMRVLLKEKLPTIFTLMTNADNTIQRSKFLLSFAIVNFHICSFLY
jgi:hypothetical protein